MALDINSFEELNAEKLKESPLDCANAAFRLHARSPGAFRQEELEIAFRGILKHEQLADAASQFRAANPKANLLLFRGGVSGILDIDTFIKIRDALVQRNKEAESIGRPAVFVAENAIRDFRPGKIGAAKLREFYNLLLYLKTKHGLGNVRILHKRKDLGIGLRQTPRSRTVVTRTERRLGIQRRLP